MGKPLALDDIRDRDTYRSVDAFASPLAAAFAACCFFFACLFFLFVMASCEVGGMYASSWGWRARLSKECPEALAERQSMGV